MQHDTWPPSPTTSTADSTSVLHQASAGRYRLVAGRAHIARFEIADAHYLASQSKLGANSAKWMELIDVAWELTTSRVGVKNSGA